jgi:hypothetical protein
LSFPEADPEQRDIEALERRKTKSLISWTLSDSGKSRTGSLPFGFAGWFDWDTQCIPHITVEEI